MNMFGFIGLVQLGSGCAVEKTTQDSEETDSAQGLADGDSAEGASTGCAYPLVRLQTSQDSSCSGGNEHLWPVGMDETDCHGWRGVDSSGGTHDNSANDIRCNGDGTFQFTQFAGNLTCDGSGVTKVYALDECEQDTPPSLYTVALDLTCCSDPDSDECITGIPSVGVPGGEVMRNGESCE
jgi:hypothetical protein